ncbi:conjugal transfer protein [Bartonella alsatica]|uniref:Conjugal transfer protein n=1 Tax=Bartonella alsatica TaxID=52764 RepID=A0ABX6QH99_9HYPH|nr:type IV secretion system protein [Bartonella alsatica]QLC51963.1 conjugal transfer protein [Bartonella alsatica]
MRKAIITIVVIAILGIPNSAMAFWGWGAGAADLSASVPSFSAPSPPPEKLQTQVKPKPQPKKPSPPKYYTDIINLLQEHLEIKNKQFEQTEKMYSSITGARENSESENSDDLYFQNPQSIYNKSRKSTLLKDKDIVKDIAEEKAVFDSVDKARNSINQRSEYAAIVDKAVSLQTFQETENRFKQISELVEQINTTNDLKSIAELQTRIKGMLAMIQNEATKLQMVAYSRDVEQALISQQKQKRNMKILNSKNKEMPTIRFAQ